MLIAILIALTVGCLLVLYFIIRTARREDGCFGCRFYNPEYSFCKFRLIQTPYDANCNYNEPCCDDTDSSDDGAGNDRQDLRDADGSQLLP